MNSTRAFGLRVLIACCCVSIAWAISTPVVAQRDSGSKYKEGDRVEVKDGFQWKKGTIVSADRGTGWIEVRVDEAVDEAARLASRDMPAELREQMLTISAVRCGADHY